MRPCMGMGAGLLFSAAGSDLKAAISCGTSVRPIAGRRSSAPAFSPVRQPWSPGPGSGSRRTESISMESSPSEVHPRRHGSGESTLLFPDAAGRWAPLSPGVAGVRSRGIPPWCVLVRAGTKGLDRTRTKTVLTVGTKTVFTVTEASNQLSNASTAMLELRHETVRPRSGAPLDGFGRAGEPQMALE